ncbi:Acyl carrier protein [bioreactor metagenome]|uniref:Acyl carrier protein n=1 Tax=bioreactor metagenome TaxID=1076179 RepID=A0A645EUJ1_9ZZZZ|nr:acyl carrier protein [Christensenella sp.]
MQEKVIKSIMTQLELDRDAVNLGSRFVEDFSMDSLDMVEMLINLEKETGIKVPVEEVGDIHTVGELIKHIEGKQQ